MNISKTFIVAILIMAQLSIAMQIGAAHDIQHQFCWKDSYGRGVGTIPNDCGHREKIGLLCYDRCPAGYSRSGFNCRQNCPSGLRDDGWYCRNAEYGRGGGFPWKARDGVRRRTRDNGMIARCEAAHGRGNCQKWGAMYYPKCRPGYHPAGCCICRPSPPNCGALGLGRRLDLACEKKKINTPPQTAGCPPGKENNAGLCYKRCNQGFYGVGPVCWGAPPKGWVDCGMGAAASSKVCANIIVGQVAAVGQMALSIATLGTSTAANAGANAAKGAAKAAQLKKQLSGLKKAVNTGKKQIEKLTKKAKDIKKKIEKGEKVKQGYEKAAEAANSVEQLMSLADDNVTQADIVRITAQIAALADPTGVASTIEAFSYPVCSKIFK